MPDAITREAQRAVRRVLARSDLCRGADRDGIGTAQRQQGADDAVTLGSHAGESRESGAAGEMEEHRLRLIVARVTRGDRRRAQIARDASQELVARLAPAILVLRWCGGATDAERRADVVRELRDERGVGGGRARASTMVEMR